VKLGDNAPIDPKQILNLTKPVIGGTRLKAELPPGKWTIIRFGYTTTGSKNHPAQPEGEGLEVDKMDPGAVAFQFEHALGRVVHEAGPLVGKVFKGIVFDSFEGGYQNWCADLPGQFRRLKGYDLTPFLPVLTGRPVGSVAESEAVLRDFSSVVNDVIAQSYFGTMSRLAHGHGLKVYAEAQGGPITPMICNEFVDVPMNEFWMPDAASRVLSIKQVSSIAHLLGRPIVAAESFTAKPEDSRWQAVPSTLKLPGDCAFTAGINRFIFHTYVHQPYDYAPGFTLGRYGTEFGRMNTWWPMADAWVGYVGRCQFLLQQGQTVHDVCKLIEEDAGYSIPDDELKVPHGYDADYCYARHLRLMTWKDGGLRLASGATYRLLVLPKSSKSWTASASTLTEIERLLDEGAVVIGSSPSAPSGWRDASANREGWQSLVRKLWNGTGAKQIKPYTKLETALVEIGLSPDVDFKAQAADADVRFIHRVFGDMDIYFVANHSTNAVELQASLRSTGRQPELWDAVSGRIVPASVFSVENGRTLVPLKLDASGSVFVVFRKPLPVDWLVSFKNAQGKAVPNNCSISDANAAAISVAQPGLHQAEFAQGRKRVMEVMDLSEPLPIQGPWQVRFQSGRGAPEAIQMDKLVSWSQSTNFGVRYFSGMGDYSTSFDVPAVVLGKGQHCVLQLGRVCDVAVVRLNGTKVGTVWTAPFEIDVTGQIHAGVNRLEIQVANRWINRLIGDESLPADADYNFKGNKFTAGRLDRLPTWLTNSGVGRHSGRITFATWKHYGQSSPLVDSGLLGPVRLAFKQPVDLRP
jgi:hypothetical protein